jgi:endoplasmic reticulum protein 29
LDELTFSKVIRKFATVLVKFDQAFPFGEIHETYMTFSQQINNKSFIEDGSPDLLITQVGIKDYGNFENKKIGDRYNIKFESLPQIRLFVDGDLKSPIEFVLGMMVIKKLR